MFIAIVAYQGDRPTKFQEFETEPEADAHVALHGGFVVPHPGVSWGHWRVNGASKTISVTMRPSKVPQELPLSAEELYDMLEARGHVTATDRPRPRP